MTRPFFSWIYRPLTRMGQGMHGFWIRLGALADRRAAWWARWLRPRLSEAVGASSPVTTGGRGAGPAGPEP